MKKTDIALKKLPPHNEEAEKSVLGAVLQDNDSIMKAMQIISHHDFYKTAHQKIFKTMIEMSKEGERIDLVTLAEKLLQSGDLEIIGGTPYLMDLMEATPTATTIIHHAKIVKNKDTLRRLIAIGTQLNLEAYGERVDSENLLNRTEELISNLREGMGGEQNKIIRLGDELPAFFKRVENSCDPNIKKEISDIIPTGFIDIDEILIGISLSDLVIIAGRPSMGKTALVQNILTNTGKSGIESLFFSIETPAHKCVERFVCTESQVDSTHLRKGKVDDAEWLKLASGMSKLSDLPVYIYDCHSLSLHDLRFKVKMAIKEFGIKLIGIDYLQQMKIEGFRGSRAEELTAIITKIKSILREFQIAGIVLSQLSREVEKRKPPRPILSDLRESGGIEQEADIVMMLYRHAYYETKMGEYGEEDLRTEVIVNKHRNGQIGTIKLIFRKEYTRFENISRDAEGY